MTTPEENSKTQSFIEISTDHQSRLTESSKIIIKALNGLSYEQAKELLQSIINHSLPMKCVVDDSFKYPWLP